MIFLSAGDTELAYFSVSTSSKSTEITKLILNNNTSICLCIVFAMTSKVRKKLKNFKVNRKGRRFKKNTKKVQDLPLYRKTCQVCMFSPETYSKTCMPHVDMPHVLSNTTSPEPIQPSHKAKIKATSCDIHQLQLMKIILHHFKLDRFQSI